VSSLRSREAEIAARVTRRGRLRISFPERYGAWALVAGASEGIGAAFARQLAGRGMNLVLVARRPGPLEQFAGELRREFDVQTLCCNGDLGQAAFLETLVATCAPLDLGLLVYNAAHSPIGEFAALSTDDVAKVVDVNVRAPIILVRALLPQMLARGRGGVLLMSSLAGMTGAPRVATYAASKAFSRVFAQALWYEMKGKNIDVLACCSGAARTPGYANASDRDAPGTLDPEQVAHQALRALGRGPTMITGRINRLADFVLNRLLSRRAAVNLMGASTSGLVHAKEPKDHS
jgi:short-subunit dehydrogenase